MEQEQHPTTKDWVGALFNLAKKTGAKLDWVNCGLCVDERGLSDGDFISGIKKVSRRDLPSLTDQHDQIWHW